MLSLLSILYIFMSKVHLIIICHVLNVTQTGGTLSDFTLAYLLDGPIYHFIILYWRSRSFITATQTFWVSFNGNADLRVKISCRHRLWLHELNECYNDGRRITLIRFIAGFYCVWLYVTNSGHLRIWITWFKIKTTVSCWHDQIFNIIFKEVSGYFYTH